MGSFVVVLSLLSLYEAINTAATEGVLFSDQDDWTTIRARLQNSLDVLWSVWVVSIAVMLAFQLVDRRRACVIGLLLIVHGIARQ